MTANRLMALRNAALLGVYTLIGSLLLVLSQSPVAGGHEQAYFEFDYPPAPQRFVFRLDDPVKIEQARKMLSGQLPSRHVGGKIIKQPAPYNPPWSYHLEPDSIVFFDHAIEVCDSSIQGVEDHLEEVCGAFLPGCTWCPWGSRLLVEVHPNTPSPYPSQTLQPSATASPTQISPSQQLFLPAVLRTD